MSLLALSFSSACLSGTSTENPLESKPKMVSDNTTHSLKVKAFKLPPSKLLSRESNDLIKRHSSLHKEYYDKLSENCPPLEGKNLEDYSSIRKCHADFFYSNNEAYLNIKKRYKTTMQPVEFAGVYAEVFTPEEGISDINKERVLINLHGGGFMGGSQTSSHIESIPIAALGKIKVISIDYRMAPEYQFPAATNDVIAVYNALLKDYKPKNIGIYGVSAGALLTAQTVARLQDEKIPLPNAIGMLVAAAHYWRDGDSGHIIPAVYGYPVQSSYDNPYFTNTDENMYLAFPGKSEDILKKFPTSLLISATRDFSLSSVVHTHRQLTSLGVEAKLHIWEGLDHGFLYNSDLEETQEAYKTIVKFFEKNLGNN